MKVPGAQHGGAIASLSNDRGYVELLVESAGQPATRGRRAPSKVQYKAYFYQSDGTTAMSPPPTDAQLEIGAGQNRVTVSLAPAKSDDAEAFVSAASSAYPDRFQGQLKATSDGKPVTADLMVR